MNETTVNTKYQVVIPKIIRKQIGIKPGQKLHIIVAGDNLVLSTKKNWPDNHLKELRNLLGIENIQAYIDDQRKSW